MIYVMEQDSEDAYSRLLRQSEHHEPSLSEREQTVLQLLAQEEDLRLEASLLKAQAAAAPRRQQNHDIASLTQSELQSQLAIAEKEALEARAAYVLRNKTIQTVIMADPILKAVHAPSTASRLERNLLPSITSRDTLSMLHSTLTDSLISTQARTFAVERQLIGTSARNATRARTMLDLAEALRVERPEDDSAGELQDGRVRARLQDADAQVAAARKDWRVVKSVVAGVVAASGVDWADDAALLELVLDDEDELGGVGK